MKVEDRPSTAAEDAKAQDVKHAQKKVALKPGQPQYLTSKNPQQLRSEKKQVFDQLLDSAHGKSSDKQDAKAAQGHKFVEKLQEQKTRQENQRQEKSRDDKNKTENSDSREETKSVYGSQVKKDKIQAKQSTGERDSGAGSGSGSEKHGMMQQTQLGKQNPFKIKKSAVEESIPIHVPSQMGQTGSSRVATTKTTETNHKLPKEVLAEIINSIQIYHNKNSEEEIQINFSTDFIKGLRLKISKRNQRVEVQFLCSNTDTLKMMQNERSDLAEHLNKNNIHVANIVVKYG